MADFRNSRSFVGFVSTASAGNHGFRLEFGLSLDRIDLALDAGSGIDEKPAAFVGGVTGDHAAVDDFRAARDFQAAGDASIDMDAPAEFDIEVPVDGTAHVEFTAFDDSDITTDRSPKGQRFEYDQRPGKLSALFTHKSKYAEMPRIIS